MATYWLIAFVLISIAYISVIKKKLTIIAAITGCGLGFLIFLSTGYTGIALMGAFFIMGTAVTSWKIHSKEQLGLAERKGGQRTTGQVIANAGIAGILSLLILFYPTKAALLRLMMAASFSSATADTVSSELGNVYGTKFYNILSFKRDSRGLNGVISIEGTVLGIAGSGVIACLYALGFGLHRDVWWIIIAGTVGNLSDSLLGATLERRHYLNNNAVNFLNTALAAITAWLLSVI